MTLRQTISGDARLAGAFIKTPSSEIIEMFALAAVDFICLDAEHSAFSRRELDWCLALSSALKLPALVRVSHASSDAILQALDGGAAGVVVPHVRSAALAADVARWARFGRDGRGYAGSTRSAGFTTKGMGTVLDEASKGTVVIAQIEDPDALDELEQIASVDGIDALFFGAADLAVGMGLTSSADARVSEAFDDVRTAASRAGKRLAAFCAAPDGLVDLYAKGASIAFVGSDQGAVLAGARAIAKAQRSITQGENPSARERSGN